MTPVKTTAQRGTYDNDSSGQRGRITLPVQIREKYGITNGDTLRIMDLDGVVVFVPVVSTISQLAREIEQARVAAGLSLEAMLADLREPRVRYYAECYGTGQPL